MMDDFNIWSKDKMVIDETYIITCILQLHEYEIRMALVELILISL